MEKRLILGEDNLDTLKSIFEHVNKSLLRYIEGFEDSNRGRTADGCKVTKPPESQLFFLIKFFFF